MKKSFNFHMTHEEREVAKQEEKRRKAADTIVEELSRVYDGWKELTTLFTEDSSDIIKQMIDEPRNFSSAEINAEVEKLKAEVN